MAAILPLALSSGCQQPLAVKHGYFVPGKNNAAKVNTQVMHVFSYSQALEAARRNCGARAPAVDTRGGPDLAMAGGSRALDRLCSAASRSSPEAYGGLANAYRRWVEDKARKLPDAAKTAGGAAGGGS